MNKTDSIHDQELMLQPAENEREDDVSGELMGLRIRKLRHQRGMSVNELAARAGVSSGIISQIERGKANPSLKTLERIRAALDVSLSTILESVVHTDSASDLFVRRATERPRFKVGPHPLLKEHLSPAGAKDLQFMIITFPPQSASEDVVIGLGEKAGLVLSGQIRLLVDDKEAVLFEGDSFQFESDVPHKVINESLDEAKVLWIMSQSPSVPHL